MVSALCFLIAAAVVFFVLAVHLLPALAGCLLATTLFILCRLWLALLGIAEVIVSCHKTLLKGER
jgi:hypothetical protein